MTEPTYDQITQRTEEWERKRKECLITSSQLPNLICPGNNDDFHTLVARLRVNRKDKNFLQLRDLAAKDINNPHIKRMCDWGIKYEPEAMKVFTDYWNSRKTKGSMEEGISVKPGNRFYHKTYTYKKITDTETKGYQIGSTPDGFLDADAAAAADKTAPIFTIEIKCPWYGRYKMVHPMAKPKNKWLIQAGSQIHLTGALGCYLICYTLTGYTIWLVHRTPDAWASIEKMIYKYYRYMEETSTTNKTNNSFLKKYRLLHFNNGFPDFNYHLVYYFPRSSDKDEDLQDLSDEV
jgi:hypothetical protein